MDKDHVKNSVVISMGLNVEIVNCACRFGRSNSRDVCRGLDRGPWVPSLDYEVAPLRRFL